MLHVLVLLAQLEAGPATRIAVTAEHLETAYRTPAARVLVAAARQARLGQDAALTGYDAMSFTRISSGVSGTRGPRLRLLFRFEHAARVQWQRGAGARVEVMAARTALPWASEAWRRDMTEEMVRDAGTIFLPYYPGHEPLLPVNEGRRSTDIDERGIVHPLVQGSEAYYTYEAGDSITYHLPDGTTVRLREIRVRPRATGWNLTVGSLWMDAASGHVVRAAYRLAEPVELLDVALENDAELRQLRWLRPVVGAVRLRVTSVTVEYGLHHGRHWMPRAKSAEGTLELSVARVPVTIEQRFTYASVNGDLRLQAVAPPDTVPVPVFTSDWERARWRDSVLVAAALRRAAERDSIEDRLKPDPCAAGGDREVVARPEPDLDLVVAMRSPCDVAVLERSPLLPHSIYDPAEALFSAADRDALIAQAIGLGAQPRFGALRPPMRTRWGMELTRFNRIEGLSSGVALDQPLGAGLTASLAARLGHADREPDVQVALSRTNLARTIGINGYNRLVASNDWGNPLGFGSSVSALLFGRDDGFYYRATGVDVEWRAETGPPRALRLFAERQRPAAVENTFTLGAAFGPNILADARAFAGATARLSSSLGLDPHGFRLVADARGEAAVSDSAGAAYARGALDLTVARGLGRASGAFTVSGGSSAGVLPAQRRWFLGGTRTVRGQLPDTAQSGTAYWLARVEVGATLPIMRPVLFGDVGWTGDRAAWRDVGRPMSGAGVGLSFMDGLVRLDLARGIHPRRRLRLDMYLEGNF